MDCAVRRRTRAAALASGDMLCHGRTVRSRSTAILPACAAVMLMAMLGSGCSKAGPRTRAAPRASTRAPDDDRSALAPPGVQAIEPKDAIAREAELSKALAELDSLRKGFDTPFDLVEQRGGALLRQYHRPEEHARIYFQLAHIEGQSGFQHLDKLIWYIEQALAWPAALEPEHQIWLYQYWGNALEAAHEGTPSEAFAQARHEMVEPYLHGLQQAVAYEAEARAAPLPTGPPPRENLPFVDQRALGFPQVAQAKRDHLLERLAD